MLRMKRSPSKDSKKEVTSIAQYNDHEETTNSTVRQNFPNEGQVPLPSAYIICVDNQP